MRNSKSLLLIPLFFFISCTSLSDSEPKKDVMGILMARPWFFFSINGNEGYDCNKQTNMNFYEDGRLIIQGYIREPDYTCSGPHYYNYTYTLLDNNTKIEFNNEVFTIAKLTDTEFIKTRIDENGQELVWVYLRDKAE